MKIADLTQENKLIQYNQLTICEMDTKFIFFMYFTVLMKYSYNRLRLNGLFIINVCQSVLEKKLTSGPFFGF
jgi:hypothetical protein